MSFLVHRGDLRRRRYFASYAEFSARARITFMKPLFLGGILSLFCSQSAPCAEALRVAAASDLRYALTEVIDKFNSSHPKLRIEVTYGSSGKFYSQLSNGAPFDMFFSADEEYPRRLYESGLGISPPVRYATGRIVLWSRTRDPKSMKLSSLAEDSVEKISIANPAHAPYGARAQEALEKAEVWARIQKKLLLGENISQAARFAESGGADFGVLSLSLAVVPPLSQVGRYEVIPADQHKPLRQSLLIMKRASDHGSATSFAKFIVGKEGQKILSKFGFEKP